MAARSLRLYELTPHRATLEEAYMSLTHDAVEYEARPMSALRAEWTKLRTVRSSWWALGLALGLTLLMSAFISSTVSTTGKPPGGGGRTC